MTSMTPTISMKPSARSPKRTPSAMPLTRWGRRFIPRSSRLVDRRLVERLEVALALRLLVDHLIGGRVAQDLEEVVRVLRFEVRGREVNRLLELVGLGVHVRVVMLHARVRRDLHLLELLDDGA